MPLLIVCTYRPEALGRDHPLHIRLPALVRESAATRLDLAALSEAELDELITARYALSASETRHLAAYLHQRADGVPLFVTELLRAAEEEGHLRETRKGWLLGSLLSVGVPPLLRQVLDGRLRHLSPEDRHLLELASVIGQEVPLDLWATVAGVAESALLDTIERGEALYLLAGSHDGSKVRFVHTLLRDACYEGASAARRRGWHRQIAEAMSQIRHCDPDAVANQFRQAGDARATEWLVRAGDFSYCAHAYRDALERYEAAAKLLAEDDPATERAWLRYRLARTYHHLDPAHARVEMDETCRLAAAAGDQALAAVALYHQGEEWYLAGEYGAGLERMATGVDALEGLSHVEQARLTVHGDLTGLADVSNARGALIGGQAMLGNFPAAVAAAERWELPPVVPGSGDSRGDRQSASGYFGLGQWRAAIGQPGEARKLLAQARDLCSVLGLSYQFGLIAAFDLSQVLMPFYADQRLMRQQLGTEIERAWRQADEFGHTPSPAVFRAPFLAAEGDWAGALALTSATLADEHLCSAHLPARCLLGRLARDRGDVSLAWQQIRDVLPSGPDTAPGTMPIAVALDLLHLAATLALDAGEPQAARPWLNAAARWLAWSGVVRWQAEQQLLWGRYHQVAGDVTRAYHVAAEAIARASEPRQPLALLAAHRFLGELATALGRTRDAGTHLAAARPLAEACALPHEHALTLLSLAELSIAEGRWDAAAAPLAEARRIAVALRAAPAVTRADALAARLDRPETAAQPSGLSMRELEVLRLLARGATNRAIAEDLYLSERTVQVHVRHILTKTDTANRAAATAFAIRHDLA
jgi:DNA-binding CsgD family transcriptional regulator